MEMVRRGVMVGRCGYPLLVTQMFCLIAGFWCSISIDKLRGDFRLFDVRHTPPF